MAVTGSKASPGPWLHRSRASPRCWCCSALAGGVYAWSKFFREVPQEVCGDVEPSRRAELCADPAEERFKYGSLGAEWDLGIPYPIFHVLPRVFGDLMPGPGGYAAFGIPWEEGRELPVGFSKKTVGFPRITQTCAICHAASYRTSPDAAPVIVPTGPSHTTNAMAFLDFLEAAANDPRWSGDGHDGRDRAQLRSRARRQADLPLPDHPDRQAAGAGAGRRTSPGSTPTAGRPGGRAATGRST